MFSLDQAIAAWRQKMAEAGIHVPEVLNELESHLRDDVEGQISAGASAQQAFESAVERIGEAAVLECEFDKIGSPKGIAPRMKELALTLAAIPNECLTEPMKISSIEPRWATYFKATAFLLPALSLWAVSVVFLIPKLQQICADAGGGALPGVIRAMMLLTHHGVLVCCVLVLLLGLLEWRSSLWQRYRRATVGVGTFVLNGVVLVSIFMMVVTAIMVAPALLHLGQRSAPIHAR